MPIVIGPEPKYVEGGILKDTSVMLIEEEARKPIEVPFSPPSYILFPEYNSNFVDPPVPVLLAITDHQSPLKNGK